MTVNRERLLSNFISFAKIPSPSLKEGKISSFICGKFRPYAKEIFSDSAGEIIGGETGNLIIKIPGNNSKPPFMLSAHLDTVAVKSKIRPLIRGNAVYSDGTTILGADCKAGIAVILEAVETFKKSKKNHPPLEIVLTVSEENALMGAKNLDFSEIKSKRGLIFDNEQDFENIIIKAPAAKGIEIKAVGKASHSGVAPEQGISAIKAAALALNKMNLGRIDFETTANIGFIRGGEGINIVPSLALMQGEIRSLSEKKIEKTENSFRAALRKARKEFPGKLKPDFEFRTESKFPALKINPSDSVVKLIKNSMKDMGHKPKLSISGGGTDANIFCGKKIITPILATGMRDVHTNGEYLDLETFFNCADLTLKILSAA